MPSPRRSLLFIVTEDWFFHSHFLPMAQAARALGLSVAVATRVGTHRAAIEAAGIRVHPLEMAREARGMAAALRTLGALTALLRETRPDLIHCIALRPVILGGLAARRAGIARRVYALTGQGFLGADASARSRATLRGLRALLRFSLDAPGVRYLCENSADAAAFAPAAASGRVHLVGGAGVALPATVAPLPAMPPLRIALVARMLWQKGIDTAVAAVALARRRGADVTLSLYGKPDAANPRPLSVETLRGFGAQEGVSWHGHSDDVAGVWATHHACCLPSRGGEGLPRALLEAAACGRALVTTAVPGCGDLVRDGVEGLVVPPDDPAALAEAFCRLASDPARVAAMGEAAWARVRDGGFTQEAVAGVVQALYAEMLGGDALPGAAAPVRS